MTDETETPPGEVDVEIPAPAADPQEDAAARRFQGRADKRINRLLSRAKAAEDRASAVEARARELERRLAATEAASAGGAATQATSAVERAQAALKAAKFDGDADAEVSALTALADAQAAARDAARAQQAAEQRAQQAQNAPEPPKASDAMKSWLDENPWFHADPAMNSTAMGFHHAAVRKGLAPESKEYFQHIDAGMRRAFPDEFDDETDAGETRDPEPAAPAAQARPTAPAAPRRANPGAPPSARTVRLTPDERDFARISGISEQEYAAQKLAIQNGGRA
jgi:hypothetical protein